MLSMSKAYYTYYRLTGISPQLFRLGNVYEEKKHIQYVLHKLAKLSFINCRSVVRVAGCLAVLLPVSTANVFTMLVFPSSSLTSSTTDPSLGLGLEMYLLYLAAGGGWSSGSVLQQKPSRWKYMYTQTTIPTTIYTNKRESP